MCNIVWAAHLKMVLIVLAWFIKLIEQSWGLIYLDLPNISQKSVGRYNKALRAGDMVFFKTGIFTRHVGMYIDKGNFLHVSSSKGVTISSLEDPYWASAYWKAQRIQ